MKKDCYIIQEPFRNESVVGVFLLNNSIRYNMKAIHTKSTNMDRLVFTAELLEEDLLYLKITYPELNISISDKVESFQM